MWEYLNQEQYDYQRPERGEIRTGMVLSRLPHEIVLDLGLKLDVIVPAEDLQKMDAKDLERIQVGTELPVLIVTLDEDNGRIVGSLSQAKVQEDWEEALRYLETGDIYDTMVAGHNKGGLIAPFGRLRGFIPTSQVTSVGTRVENGVKIERLEQMQGKKIKVKVIEVNQKRKRLIMSERAAMKEWRQESKSRLLDELKEGDVRKGIVTNLMNFGAFIDLGGADGLIHVSEMAWHRVKHPKDVLEVGQEVEVVVMTIDRNEERIALSMKRLAQDPWQAATAKYQIGDIVEAEITNLTDFGAFARIGEGIEGLIHVSELAEAKVDHPRNVVHRGQRVTVRVISIDSDRQRVGLSLKQVPTPLEEGEADAESGTPKAETASVANGESQEATTADTMGETPRADETESTESS
jgi:small subunit ribosomal protein S1